MKWAIEEMMRWKGGAPNPAVVHIHGDKDRIFPIGRIKNAITIAGGSHFMIVNRAKEISSLSKRRLANGKQQENIPLLNIVRTYAKYPVTIPH